MPLNNPIRSGATVSHWYDGPMWDSKPTVVTAKVLRARGDSILVERDGRKYPISRKHDFIALVGEAPLPRALRTNRNPHMPTFDPGCGCVGHTR